MRKLLLAMALTASAWSETSLAQDQADARYYCVTGSIDLGHRLQGLEAGIAERHPARWCVASADGEAVRVEIEGRINSDVEGDFTTFYDPANSVVVVGPPDRPQVRFTAADIAAEARRALHLDPHWLKMALPSSDGIHRLADEAGADVLVTVSGGRVTQAQTLARLPLRGIVPATYRWEYQSTDDAPSRFLLEVDRKVFFEGIVSVESHTSPVGRWAEVADLPEAPGEYWPTRIGMNLEELAPRVYRMQHSRSGFYHLVIETEAGLVVADAPAGWTELSQLPPVDMLPDSGISGLSERFVDALAEEFPDTPMRAVVLTHHHDDHAGGARGFAAAGAQIFAPAGSSAFLGQALNREDMPDDRLGDGVVTVIGVTGQLRLDDAVVPVELLSMNGGPHASAMVGLWLPDQRFFFQSDMHNPAGEDETPDGARAQAECWFARWAQSHLPSDAQILSSHSPVITPRSRLDAYLQSQLCAEPG